MTPDSMRHEDELLLCCARSAIDDETSSRIQALISRNIEWRYLIDRANHHRVVPLLYQGLAHWRAGPVPSGVMAELARQCAAIAGRNLFLMAELIKINRWLDGQRIRAIPYKGPVSAVVAFGNIGMRQFGDLDILVQTHDYSRARDLFLHRGFRVGSDWGWECTLVDDARLLSVDLHRGLAPVQFPVRLDFDGLWDRRQPVSIGGGSISTFGLEDMLIVLCIQLIKDSWGESALRLSKVCDIAEMLRARLNIDWMRILDATRIMGCRKMLCVSVTVAHQLLGAPVQSMPNELRDLRLSRLADHIRHRLFEQSETGYHGELSRTGFHFKIRERWRDKLYPWYYEFKLRLIPNELDRAVMTLPPSFDFLYYVIRPLRVARDAGRAFFKRLKVTWATWIR